MNKFLSSLSVLAIAATLSFTANASAEELDQNEVRKMPTIEPVDHDVVEVKGVDHSSPEAVLNAYLQANVDRNFDLFADLVIDDKYFTEEDKLKSYKESFEDQGLDGYKIIDVREESIDEKVFKTELSYSDGSIRIIGIRVKNFDGKWIVYTDSTPAKEEDYELIKEPEEVDGKVSEPESKFSTYAGNGPVVKNYTLKGYRDNQVVFVSGKFDTSTKTSYFIRGVQSHDVGTATPTKVNYSIAEDPLFGDDYIWGSVTHDKKGFLERYIYKASGKKRLTNAQLRISLADVPNTGRYDVNGTLYEY